MGCRRVLRGRSESGTGAEAERGEQAQGSGRDRGTVRREVELPDLLFKTQLGRRREADSADESHLLSRKTFVVSA